MADLFGRQEQVLAGGLSSDRLFMSFSGLPQFGLGLLIQGVSTAYSQPLRRIYELGPGAAITPNGIVACTDTSGCGGQGVQTTYYAVGRSSGSFQFQRIAGVEGLAPVFYQTYGTPCSSNVLSFGGRLGCKAGNVLGPLTRWLMTGLTLTQYQNSAAPEQSFIQEGSGGEFINLFVQTEA